MEKKHTVLMLSIDRKIFDADSDVRRRMVSYGEIFEQLHIVVLNRSWWRLLETEKIAPNVWVYPTNSWSRFLYLFDVFNVVKRELAVHGELAADIISAQEFDVGYIGLRLAQKYKRKLQIQIHGDPWNPYSKSGLVLNRVRLWVGRIVLRQADCVRAVSEKVKREVEQRFPRLTGKVSVLPVFVDIDRLRQAEPSFDLHQKYPQFKFVVLMVSRLSKEKNVGFALNVFARMLRTYPRAGLVIVGDGPEKRALVRKAKRLGIREQVVFEGWQNDLVSYYKTANLFLHTSLYEGLGMVLIEAAASGLPIVTSDVGVASSIKREMEGTFVCPVNDAECFARETVSFLKDNTRRVLFKFGIEGHLENVITTRKEDYLKAYQESIELCYTPRNPI